MTRSEQHRLTTRWATSGYNVVTDEDGDGDGKFHVATTTSSHVAAHLVELHNRTFGDGQDAPSKPGPFVGFLRGVEDAAIRAHQRLMDDETQDDLERRKLQDAEGTAIPVNPPRAPLLFELVDRRLTEILADQPPPRVQVDVTAPTDMLIKVLESRGYRVTPKASPE